MHVGNVNGIRLYVYVDTTSSEEASRFVFLGTTWVFFNVKRGSCIERNSSIILSPFAVMCGKKRISFLSSGDTVEGERNPGCDAVNGHIVENQA